MRFRLLPPDPELGWTPFGYLVYLGFFLFKPVVFPEWPWERPLTAAAVAVFLVLYFRVYWLSGWRVLVPLGGIFALGVLFAPINYGSGCFMIYAGAFAAWVGPPRRAWGVLLTITALAAIVVFTLQDHPAFWVPMLIFTPLIGALNIHHRTMQVANEKLRISQAEVSRLAQIAERERIARDLHDLLGHNLAMITLKSELAARLAESDPVRAAAEMREVERISRETTREVRAAVAGYRSRSLSEEVGRARDALEAAGVTLEDAFDDVELEPLVEGGIVACSARGGDQRRPPCRGSELPPGDDRHVGRRRRSAARNRRRRLRRPRSGRSRPARHARAGHRPRRPARARRRGGDSPGDPPAAAAAGGGERRVIRVLIVEDQAMVLGALAALLELEDDIEVVDQARSAEEALEQLAAARPDVVLTDIEMPGMTGLELAAELHRRRGAPRVIILTTFARGGYLRRALDAGAGGYLLKDAPAEQLADAVRRVHRGLKVIDPELAVAAWSEPDPLTDRERQVLRRAGEGASTAQIAGEIHLAEGTVRNYLSEAIGKLGASNRVEAARLARDRGWL